MSLATQRTLVIFSVALNIGFIIIAIYHYYLHAGSPSERYEKKITAIVRELNLPESKEAELKTYLTGFWDNAAKLREHLWESRLKVLPVLAQPGPLDRDQLKKLIWDTGRLSLKKQTLFEDYAIEVYQILGDEKATYFFGRLLENRNSTSRGHG